MLTVRYVLLLSLYIYSAAFYAQDSLSFVYLGENIPGLKGITSLSEDEQGNIWIGTREHGVFVYDGYHFENFIQHQDKPISLPNNHITSISPQMGKGLLVSTSEGVIQINKSKGVLDILKWKNIDEDEINPFHVLCFWQREDNLWLGTTVGLVHYSLKDSVTEHYPILDMKPFLPLMEYYIYEIIKDPHHERIWLGTTYGLKCFDLQSKTFLPIKNLPKWHPLSPRFPYMIMFDIYIDKQDIIWLAGLSSGGILRYDISSGEWGEYLYQNDPSHPYPGNGVRSLLPINDITMYYTSDLGVGYLDFNRRKLVLSKGYNMQRGGRIYRTFIDRKGFAWFASEYCLVKTEEPLFPTFPHPSSPAFIALTNPNKEPISYRSDSLHLDRASAGSWLEIGVINPKEKQPFLYKWNINHTSWSPPSERRFIPTDDCSYGQNTIDISASIDGKHWVQGTPITLYYQKPYYLTESFLGLLGSGSLLLTGIFFLIFRCYKRLKRKRKRAHEMQLIELEMQSLRYQMNPHFIFNSLSSINTFILKEETESASEYLTKFSKLMRAVLQNSKNKLVPLSEELTTLNLYLELEKLRFRERFEYKIIVNLRVEPSSVLIPPTLIQPFIENSIWHGIMPKSGKGCIQLIITEEGEKLSILIQDNGVGREWAKRVKRNKNSTKKSLSMRISQDRIQAINRLYGTNSKIKVIDLYEGGNATGTQVIITLKKVTQEKFLTE